MIVYDIHEIQREGEPMRGQSTVCHLILMTIFALPNVAPAAERELRSYYSAGSARPLWIEVATNPKRKELRVWFEPSTAPAAVLTRDIDVKLQTPEAHAALRARPGYLAHHRTPFLPKNWYVARFDTPLRALQAANALSQSRAVVAAHPDFRLSIETREVGVMGIPEGEPFFDLQWHLSNTGQTGGTAGADLGVLEVWPASSGNSSTIVAVLDLGFEQEHPDLREAWLVNSGEIPNNKKDDDQNGLVDDVNGWNFSTDNNKLLYGRNNKHGTAVAGIVGARVNGIGVSGVCPECRLLPVVIDGTPSRDAQAIGYAAARGASVITNSWGYTISSPKTDILVDAINEASLEGRDGKGISILFAMTNANKNDCRATNPDISSLPAVIAISSVDHNDRKVETSGWGECLAFVSPSSPDGSHGIVTTDRVGAQGYNTSGASPNMKDTDYSNAFYGTSAAAPSAAGVFALLYAQRPDLSAQEALATLREAAVKVHPEEAAYDAVTGRSLRYGFGRIRAVTVPAGR
jgi:subtilisin family serine protease